MASLTILLAARHVDRPPCLVIQMRFALRESVCLQTTGRASIPASPRRSIRESTHEPGHQRKRCPPASDAQHAAGLRAGRSAQHAAGDHRPQRRRRCSSMRGARSTPATSTPGASWSARRPASSLRPGPFVVDVTGLDFMGCCAFAVLADEAQRCQRARHRAASGELRADRRPHRRRLRAEQHAAHLPDCGHRARIGRSLVSPPPKD